MKKTISLILLGLFCCAGAAKAQTLEQSAQMEDLARKLQYNPQLIWKAFLETEPAFDDVIKTCYDAEPYQTWCYEEVMRRATYATAKEHEKDSVGWIAARLVSEGLEPRAGNAWMWLKENGNAWALSNVLQYASPNYQRRAFETIRSRFFSFESREVANLLCGYNTPDKYKMEILNMYLASNPPDGDLAWLVKTCEKLQEPYRRTLFYQLLTYNPSDSVLASLLTAVTAGESLGEEIANMLLARNPDNAILREMADTAPEPYKSFAQEQLLLRGLEKREILIELMYLNKKPPQR